MKERKLVGMVTWREMQVGWCFILLSKFVYKKEARAVFKVIYLFLRGVAVNWRMEWGSLIKVYNLFDNDVQDLGDHYCLAAESFVCILSQKFQPLNSLRLAFKGRLKVQFNYSRSILSYLYTVNEKYGYIKECNKENLCQVNKEKNKLHKKDFKRKKSLQ